MPSIDADMRSRLVPGGTLRAAINLGNPLLARRDGDGDVRGVSVDLARELAARLATPLSLHVVDTAAASVQAVRDEVADIGFFAIDPARGAGLAFTAPYLLIEGAYLVRGDAPLAANEEVDRAGTRVVVGRGSAYDLHLTRALERAEIVRAPSSQTVVQTFLDQHHDVAAGVRQQLEADAARHPGLRLLPGRFMVIQQAMGLPQARGDVTRRALAGFVEEMKAAGFVAAALARHAVHGASVAPGADHS